MMLKSIVLSLFYVSNEPKSVLAQDLGDCRDNLRNSQSVFLKSQYTVELVGKGF